MTVDHFLVVSRDRSISDLSFGGRPMTFFHQVCVGQRHPVKTLKKLKNHGLRRGHHGGHFFHFFSTFLGSDPDLTKTACNPMETANHRKRKNYQKNTKKREKTRKRPWQKIIKKGPFSYRS
jgi:hypothetical protein